MNFTSCPQTPELAAAVRDGTWPMACESGLRAHVSDCPTCSELVFVVETLRRDRAAAIESASLGSPNLLWWRAQLMRRQRAMQQMAEPIGLAGQVSLGVMVLFIVGLMFWWPSAMGDWLPISTRSLNPFEPDGVWSQAVGLFPLSLSIVGVTILGLFGGLALYLICQRE